MKSKLSFSRYGKSAVRVVKLIKHKTYHEFREVNVEVLLTGDYTDAHKKGDNTKVLPTDTVKNTIFILAKDHLVRNIETFGLEIAKYFLKKNKQVEGVEVSLEEYAWNRVPVTKEKRKAADPYTYQRGSNEKTTCHIIYSKKEKSVVSGIADLSILKTTKSGFSDFYEDDYTTLKNTDDRILCTTLEAQWKYKSLKADFTIEREVIRQSLLDTFAAHDSLSVQHTLFAMGNAALNATKAINDIDISMPNKHNLLVNLEPFGLENDNEIFVATDDPFGVIEGTVSRK